MSGGSFDFLVDTEPMGASLNVISHNVNAAAGTVLRSTEALLAAEDEASRTVSQKISSGFFMLIRSQLEQKKAQAKSSVDAKSAQLVAEKNAAIAMEQLFLADFNRIKNRYSKLFSNLNRALKLRVSEIDEPVFRIVEREYRQAMRKRLFSVGGTVVSGLEGGRANSILRSGQAKGQVLKMLESARKYLTKTQQLKKQIFSVLGTEVVESPTEICLPFVVAETDGALADTRLWNFSTTKGSQDFRFTGELEAGVGSLDIGKTEWAQADADLHDSVARHFYARLERIELDPRIAARVKQLFDESSWLVMKGLRI